MPFDFLRRRGKGSQPAEGSRPETGRRATAIPFDGLTEEWRLRGRMLVDARLSDVLNRREPIAIDDVQWAPVDGSAEFSPAPGLKSVDPYDLILVLAPEISQPRKTDAERAAHRVHKVPYDVALEAPPFRVLGTVLLYPGLEPERLLDRATEMFVPVLDASAFHEDRPIADLAAEAILVNRSYLRGVEQVDRRTGERPLKLPGAPLGGVSWQDRTR